MNRNWGLVDRTNQRNKKKKKNQNHIIESTNPTWASVIFLFFKIISTPANICVLSGGVYLYLYLYLEMYLWGSDTVRMHPINSFELLFFAVFGQTTTEQTQVDKIKNVATPTQPYWVEYLFKIVFGIYMLVSVVVLINLLIAMMSDTYQRIQVVLLNALLSNSTLFINSYFNHKYINFILHCVLIILYFSIRSKFTYEDDLYFLDI